MLTSMKRIIYIGIISLTILSYLLISDHNKKNNEDSYSLFYVENNHVLFDTINIGESYYDSFILHNNTSDTIKVLEKSISCDCLNIEYDFQMLLPNCSDSIRFKFTSEYPGYLTRSIVIITSYSPLPIDLIIHGYVKE